jgi:hypothetical protein
LRTTVASALIGLIDFSFFSSASAFSRASLDSWVLRMRSSSSDFVLAVLAVAEFLLNGLHLLIQIILALRLLHLGLDAGLDLLFDLQDGQFALHLAIDLLQPFGHDQGFQKILLLPHLDAQMAGHKVGQPRRFAGFGDGGDGLFGDVLLDLGVALEFVAHSADQGLDRVGVARGFVQHLGAGLEEGRVVKEFGDAHARLALDQHLHGAIGQFQQLQHIGQHARAVDALGAGSSTVGSSWLESRICLSSCITSSSALTDFSRPTNSGTIMWGKTTMSRSGRTG